MQRTDRILWIAALVPVAASVLIATLSDSDLRQSGAMSLFALTPAALMLLVIKRGPWRRRGIKRKIPEFAATGFLGLMFLFLFVGGTPEYMKAQFGWFIGIDDYGPRSIIAGPNGFVIVGDDAGGRAIIWTSTNGHTWERVPHDPVLNRLDVGAGVYWGDQYVLVAHDDKHGPVVTLVSEDGHRWTRGGVSRTDGTPYAAVVGGESIAVVGASFSNDGLFLYGRHPNELITADPAPRIDTNRNPVDVATIGDGFVSILNHKSDAVVFTSTDGSEWDESVRFEQAEFSSLASFNGGYVVVGRNSRTDQSAVWKSSDGLTWNEVDVPTDIRAVHLELIRGDGDRLVLVGTEPDSDQPVLWWSEDGINWGNAASPVADALIRDLVIRGDRVIMTGIDRTLDSTVIWFGEPDGELTRVAHDEVLFSIR